MLKNLRLKKVNKSFLPEPISCISGFPMSISRIHILVDLLDPLYVTIVRLVKTVERSPTARETGVQSQVESYQRLKNGTWYLFA